METTIKTIYSNETITSKSEATLSEVLKLKQVVGHTQKEDEMKFKAVETMIFKLESEISKKHTALEDDFEANFEMIKTIVLSTDKETM